MSEVLLAGYGATLKSAREIRSLTVADVSEKLKLSPRQVEAIELEDVAFLPSGIYLRGFVRNYARLLGVPVDTLIAPINVDADVPETLTAKNEDVRLVSTGVRNWLLVPVLIMILFVVLVGLLYEWLRNGGGVGDTSAPGWRSAPAASLPVPLTTSLSAPSVTESVPSITASSVNALPASVRPSATPAALSPPIANTASASPTVPVPVIAEQSPAPATVLTSPSATIKPLASLERMSSSNDRSLRFEVGQAAWISIVDGKGQRFSKLVPTGGREIFKGDPPFRLVVGEAAKVRLTYNGHLIDLTPYIGQKVARLTLE